VRLKLIKLFTLVVIVIVSLVLLIPIMVMLFLLVLISSQVPSLIELFSIGTKFRRNFLSKFSIEEAIDKGLKMFVNKQEELQGFQGILSDWKAKVPLFVQKWTHASSVVQTSLDSSLSVPLGDLDHLKSLQQFLVFTYMDKRSNNFVFVCKKFYVSSVFS
jgi:hypothetical protein